MQPWALSYLKNFCILEQQTIGWKREYKLSSKPLGGNKRQKLSSKKLSKKKLCYKNSTYWGWVTILCLLVPVASPSSSIVCSRYP